MMMMEGDIGVVGRVCLVHTCNKAGEEATVQVQMGEEFKGPEVGKRDKRYRRLKLIFFGRSSAREI